VDTATDSEAMNASTSAGSHCHGYWLLNRENLRIRSSLGLIVLSPLRNRARCWVAQPVSIASNIAAAGSR